MNITKEQPKHRFQVLDIFRGIFASLIVFFHMSGFTDTTILNNDFIRNSDIFVDFFFVLSGFVICYAYQNIETATDVSSFIKKRLQRIYPLHFAILIAFLLAELIKSTLASYIHINNSLQNTPLTFVTNLFLINSIAIPGVKSFSWNSVSWSISAELIAYIVFAIICFLLTAYKLSGIKGLVYTIVAVASFLLMYVLTGNFDLVHTFDFGFLRSLVGFFTGTVCFYTFKYWHKPIKEISDEVFTIMETVIIIVLVIAITFGRDFTSFGLLYELLFFISILIFAFEKGVVSKYLSTINVLKNVGKYSYSIYMVHTLIISLFNVIFIRLLKFPISSYAYLFIINYIVIYYVSRWCYYNIELRFQHKKV
ncbi:MAG: acyltransferase [Pedobacter sp.]|nr:MAG: acyltransferase [Pedobacter sp.]